MIEVYGFLNSAIGLGETARLLVRSLRAAGCAVRPVAVPLKGRDRVDFTIEELPAGGPSRAAAARILHLNPEHIAKLLPLVPDDFFSSARIVIVPYWETENLPEEAKPCARYFDEVWCTTRFLAETFGRGFGLPLRVFPAPLLFPETSGAGRVEKFGFEDRYVFLFSFDYFSCFKRKNPDGLCEAFTKAFPAQDPQGPVLVIKSAHANEHFAQNMYLKVRFSDRKDIIFIDGYIEENERAALFHRCEAYVSLHRSEGLGMTILEAMAQGKPSIATAYSGNLDFTLPDHSYPVHFRKSRIGPGSIHYPEDEEWAEPDLDAAAMAMRDCFINQEAAREKGAKALAWVSQHHQVEKVGEILLGFINDLLARPHDGAGKQRRLDELAASKPLLQSGHAGLAYKSLKQARERIREAETLLDALPKKHKQLSDVCRQLAQSNKLLASAISDSLKLSKESAVAKARAENTKAHFEDLLMMVIVEKLQR